MAQDGTGLSVLGYTGLYVSRTCPCDIIIYDVLDEKCFLFACSTSWDVLLEQ